MESPPAGHHLVQSVDVLSEIVSDPFMLGRIAAVHALSDLYAALATPTSALAIINLPEANLSIQTNQLTQILAGGLFALSEAGVSSMAAIQAKVVPCRLGFRSPAIASKSRQWRLLILVPGSMILFLFSPNRLALA